MMTLSAALLSWFEVYVRQSRRTEEQKEREQLQQLLRTWCFCKNRVFANKKAWQKPCFSINSILSYKALAKAPIYVPFEAFFRVSLSLQACLAALALLLSFDFVCALSAAPPKQTLLCHADSCCSRLVHQLEVVLHV